MAEYNLLLTKRTYVAPSEESARSFAKDVGDLVQGVDIARTRGMPLDARLDVSIDFGKLDSTSTQYVMEALRFLENQGIQYFAQEASRTAREKFVDALFTRTSELRQGTITALTCLDQYPIGTPEALDAVQEIARKMVGDKRLYGNGSRNVPVDLATTKEADHLRKIHELFHSLAIGSSRLASEPMIPTQGLTEAYRQIGESTSGFYFINPEAIGFPVLRSEVIGLNTPAAPWFSIEYFTALRAGMLGEIASGYVFANKNPFDANAPEAHDTAVRRDREMQKFTDNIANTCSFLAGTNVAGMLEAALRKPENFEILSKHFQPEEVAYTRDIMLEGLEAA